ncbi:MAG: sigma-70 family RNA polymerase sigma factor [Chthonomonas sp.]|nr:sigma-70 family RNA polymerase sigma factor [Chthonomonas sp.]
MNASAFETLANRHKDAVYRQMIRVCNHREDAEDALATALMLAFQAHDQLRSEEGFRTWLGTIGARVCARMRHHKEIHTALEFAEEHNLLNDASEFDAAVIKGCVKDAIEQLPTIYREIYVACELEEQTVVEAALHLGITHNAAKSRLLRARVLVRQSLDTSICST